MSDKFKELAKNLSFKIMPFFIFFCAGTFYGTSSSIYSIEKDCALMSKTRIADRVYSCERK